MDDVKYILDRIKSLEYYEVSIPVPPKGVSLDGKIPFYISITEDTLTCRVLAASYQEASEKVFLYFNSDLGDTIG